MDNIFEKATRLKLRFNSGKGEISVEELWDLKLSDLDMIARAVNKKLKEEDEESFIGKKSKAKSDLTLKLDILKNIIAIKQDEDEKAKLRTEKKAQKDFMSELLQKKKLNALESMSIEDIEKQLATLNDEN